MSAISEIPSTASYTCPVCASRLVRRHESPCVGMVDRGRHGRDNGGDIARMLRRKSAENLKSAAAVAETSGVTIGETSINATGRNAAVLRSPSPDVAGTSTAMGREENAALCLVAWPEQVGSTGTWFPDASGVRTYV